MSRRRPTSSPFSLFSFQDIITATTGILILLALILALSVVVQGNQSVEPKQELVDTTELEQEIEQLENEISLLVVAADKVSKQAAAVSNLTPDELKNKFEALKASIAVLQSNIDVKEALDKSNDSRLAELRGDSQYQQEAKKLAQLKQNVSLTKQKIEKLKKDNRVVYNFRQSSAPPWLVEISGAEIKAAKAGVKQPARVFATAKELVEFSETLTGRPYFVLLVKPSGVSKYALARPYLETGGAEIGVELLSEDENAIDIANGAAF